MSIDMKNKIISLNILTTEIESLYHKASVKLNMSDSRSIVLYCIYESENKSCLLSDIYKLTGISKQTINSSLRLLEEDNIVKLENVDNKSKRISLTEEGIIYSEKTIAKLCEAEAKAFSVLSDKEIDTYISIMKKLYSSLNEEVDKII